MAQQRQYETATLFNMRAVDMRHLWNPSMEFKGKKQDKASYFGSFIAPKTQAQWHTEPQLAGLVQALTKLNQNNPQLNEWPVADGDVPNPETGKQSEWARGHWIVSASTYDTPPNVELVQAGGQLVKLTNKVGVKSGDFCLVGVSAAVSQNKANKVKLYLNAVVFSGPGEEIVFANSVSGAELMRMAQQQGLQVAGFSGGPGAPFSGAPGGFAPQMHPGAQPNFGGHPAPAYAAPQPNFGGQQAPQPGFGQPGFFLQNGAPGGYPGQTVQSAPGGFTPQTHPGAQPGFTQPGGQFAPTTGNPATPGFAAPAPGGQGFGGNATYPSNTQFAPPANPFPQR